ncbi:Serralysin C precursor [Roseibium album]|nr:Serralysin C precursor [Roseibium album]
MALSYVFTAGYGHEDISDCCCAHCALENALEEYSQRSGQSDRIPVFADQALQKLIELGLLSEIGDGRFQSANSSTPQRADQQATASSFPYDTNTNDADQGVDGLISGTVWDQTALTFSFPASASDYEANYYNSGALPTISGFNATQIAVTYNALDEYASISGLTFTELGDDAGEQKIDADLRFARSDDPGTAYAYYPSDDPVGGDSMFNTNGYNSPQIGNYQYHTFLHEFGHTLGLKHGHSTSGPGAVPYELDSMEFTVMTYRSWVGKPLNYGYANETWGFAQSLMMLDIAAIQRMYGANFTTEAGNTTYSFSTSTGEMFIDGVGVGTPGGNRVFRTVWDGDGIDTYDLSNYTTDLAIDLTPGGYSDFDVGGNFQRAMLDFGYANNPVTYARGHLFNALQFGSDVRSLIENAVGGSGDDSFVGNAADNTFHGGAGNDSFYASAGLDTYYGDSGSDSLFYDTLFSSFSFAVSGTFLQIIGAALETATDLVADTVENIVFSDQIWTFANLFALASGGNAAPAAGDDSYDVDEDAVLNGTSVLGNDSDSDGDLISVSAVNGQTANVGSQITLASGALLTMNADGTFTYDPNGAFDHLNLGESGADSFTYTVSDGILSDTASVDITVDGFSLPIATIDSAADDQGSLQGPLNDGDSTDDTTPVLSGSISVTLAAGQSVAIYRGGALLGAASVSGTSWTYADAGLTEGPHTYTAQVVEGAESGPLSSSFSLTVDVTPPAAPTVDPQPATYETTPIVTGTAILGTGESLTVTVDGTIYADVPVSGGVWSLELTTALGDGTYDVVATVMDAAGNATSDLSVGELTIDTSSGAPIYGAAALSETLVGTAGSDIISGLEENSTATGRGTIDTLTGNGGNDTFILGTGTTRYYDDGNSRPGNNGKNDYALITDFGNGADKVQLNGSGYVFVNFSVNGQTGTGIFHDFAGNGFDSKDELIGLLEGVDPADLVATPQAGNLTYVTFSGVDTTPPVVTVNALVTTDTTPELTGTVDDPAASVEVTVDGQTLAATNNGDGTWTLADNLLSALAIGTYNVSVSATDLAGNIGSDASADELVIEAVDVTPPVVTVDTQVTSDTTPELTGTVDDPSATIEVTVDGQTLAATNNGDGTWTLADNLLSALAIDTYDVSVTATDLSNNVGVDSSAGELTIEADVTPPVVSVNALTTSDTTPELTGTVDDPTASIEITVDGQVLAAANNGDGTWTLADNLLSALLDGTYEVIATATDGTGNVGIDASSEELTIVVSGDNFIFGSDGSDVLPGTDGRDIISGMPSGGSSTWGDGTVDRMTGAGDADTFVLGEVGQRYYDDGNSKAGNNGKSDYALIEDFEIGADTIQLAGTSPEYLLETWTQNGTGGTGVFHDANGNGSFDSRDELIGLVANLQPGDLDIGSDFIFV